MGTTTQRDPSVADRIRAATATGSTIVLPAEMCPQAQAHRLIALQVGDGLAAAEWPEGSRLVMDADVRTPPWEALAVIHIEGRCQVGHLTPLEGACLLGARIDDCRMIMEPGRILGTIIAVAAPLAPRDPP